MIIPKLPKSASTSQVDGLGRSQSDSTAAALRLARTVTVGPVLRTKRKRSKKGPPQNLPLAAALDFPLALPAQHSFSFSVGADSSDYSATFAGAQVKAWPIADSTTIPPPPNTPASHLIERRELLLHHARLHTFHTRCRPDILERLENLTFRISPLTRTICAGRHLYSTPPPNGHIRSFPSRAVWRDLVPIATPAARRAQRARKAGKADVHQPKEVLKRKLHRAAFADYVAQRMLGAAKRPTNAPAPPTSHAHLSLRFTAALLNAPGSQVIDLSVGETLEEKVKAEMLVRDAQGKKRAAAGVRRRREGVFTGKMRAAGRESVGSGEFEVVEGRRGKLGKKIAEKVRLLKEKVKGKLAPEGRRRERELRERLPLLAVDF